MRASDIKISRRRRRGQLHSLTQSLTLSLGALHSLKSALELKKIRQSKGRWYRGRKKSSVLGVQHLLLQRGNDDEDNLPSSYRTESPLLLLRLCQFFRQNRSQIQRVLLGQRLNTLNNALFRLQSQIFNCLQFSESDRVRFLGNCLNDSRC